MVMVSFIVVFFVDLVMSVFLLGVGMVMFVIGGFYLYLVNSLVVILVVLIEGYWFDYW